MISLKILLIVTATLFHPAISTLKLESGKYLGTVTTVNHEGGKTFDLFFTIGDNGQLESLLLSKGETQLHVNFLRVEYEYKTIVQDEDGLKARLSETSPLRLLDDDSININGPDDAGATKGSIGKYRLYATTNTATLSASNASTSPKSINFTFWHKDEIQDDLAEEGE